MIGLDTNVVIRFLTQDDPVQSPIATRAMARLTRERPGFIGVVVLAEIAWVLSRAYKRPRAEIARTVSGLLESAEIVVENAPAAYRALAAYQKAAFVEFADALIAVAAASAGADETLTFDKSAASELGMRQLK